MKTPARMAPPERSGLTPMASSIVAVMTPIVATVPKAVPVSVERRPLRRKAARSAPFGRDEARRIRDETGDRARSPPRAREHADERHDDHDAHDGAHALRGHGAERLEAVSAEEPVAREEEEACDECPDDRMARECAGEDGGGEEAEDDAFKHDEVCVSSN